MPAFRPRDTNRARELRRRATPAERELWRHLSRAQIGAKFCRQMPVEPFFADFLCRELRLIVEIDGQSHDRQPDRDRHRDQYLADAGFRVIHFTNAEVMRDAGSVVEAIHQEVEALRETVADQPVMSLRKRACRS